MLFRKFGRKSSRLAAICKFSFSISRTSYLPMQKLIIRKKMPFSMLLFFWSVISETLIYKLSLIVVEHKFWMDSKVRILLVNFLVDHVICVNLQVAEKGSYLVMGRLKCQLFCHKTCPRPDSSCCLQFAQRVFQPKSNKKSYRKLVKLCYYV